MKRILSLFFFIPSIILFCSCSSDDSGKDNESPADQLIGTWSLTEFNVNPPQDLNDDDVTSGNLIDELDCLTTTLVLNADFSWNSTGSTLDIQHITGDLYHITCTTPSQSSNSGTWSFSNNTLSLGSTDSSFQLNGTNRLIDNRGKDLPEFQSIVYEKQ